MNIRTKIRRWRMGADLHDRATLAIASAENTEAAGRSQAHAFIRNLHAEHPNPQRICTVPDCCGDA